MAYNVKNIIIGAASLYVSTKDSSNATFFGASGQVAVQLPTFTASQSAVDQVTKNLVGDLAGADWSHLGFTTDGVEFSYEPDFGEVPVDQLLDAARIFKQGMKASVNTTLGEATLKNLMLAWGQPSGSLTTSATEDELGIASGFLLDEPIERSLVFVGPAPRSTTNVKRERVYHVRRALNVESSSHKLAKTDATTIPVSLRLLPDPYYAGREYGRIIDRNVGT